MSPFFATLSSPAKEVTVRLTSSTRLPRGAAVAILRQPNLQEPDVIMLDMGRATVADLDLAIAKLGDLWPSARPQSAVSFIPRYPDAAKKNNKRKHDDSEKLLLMLAVAKRSPVSQLGNVPSITFTLKSDRSMP